MNTTDQTIQAAIRRFASGGARRSVAVQRLEDGAPLLHEAGHAPRPAASVIKLALAIAAEEAFQANRLNGDETRRVADLPDTRYASVIHGLSPDHRLSLREMLHLTLITSDNPMTTCLLDAVGMAAVNAVLRRLAAHPESRMDVGFDETALGPRGRANRLTAADAIALMAHIHAHYPTLEAALASSLRNTRLSLFLDEDWHAPHKTGSLNGVVNDVGMVAHKGRGFLIAVLTDGEADPVATARTIGTLARAVADAVLV
ncbi:serine hydrolase [Yunchengibacter salinarum]|uniref:serine hydrolase n=1 Tax=Yunchengibacter salinarum TaxID=3133399 RepID=UPI0035B66B2D